MWFYVLASIKLIIPLNILYEVLMKTTTIVVEVGGNNFQLSNDSDPIGKDIKPCQEKRLKILSKCLYDQDIWKIILEASILWKRGSVKARQVVFVWVTKVL